MKKDLLVTAGINLTSVTKMPKGEKDVLMNVHTVLNFDVDGTIEFVNAGK